MENELLKKIGHTELARLDALEKKYHTQASLYAKLEYQNPTGSIKDRAALYMLVGALSSGRVAPGAVVIEATSGNTGIGLAYFAREMGFRAIIVMPDSMSEERRRLMKKYGAELVLTDGKLGMSAAVEKAEEIQKNTPNSFIAGQFYNPDNALSHYETTGPEIFAQTQGKVDVLVAAVGSGGTISGIGRYLKEMKPSVKVIAVEPASSPLLSLGRSGPHKIQGIGANVVPQGLDRSVIDEILTVTNEEAFFEMDELKSLQNIPGGISAGANVAAAVAVANRAELAGKTVVTLIPDGEDRYR